MTLIGEEQKAEQNFKAVEEFKASKATNLAEIDTITKSALLVAQSIKDQLRRTEGEGDEGHGRRKQA